MIGVDILEPYSYALAILEKDTEKATPALETYHPSSMAKESKPEIVGRNGSLVGLRTIRRDEEILLITTEGVTIRFEAKDISNYGS